MTDPHHDVEGWVGDYDRSGNRLYINRGTGVSAVPIRINAPAELTRLTISFGDEPAA